MRLAHLRSATDKSVLHFDRRDRVVGILRTCLMFKLKTRLVNDRLVDDRGFSQLNTLFSCSPNRRRAKATRNLQRL